MYLAHANKPIKLVIVLQSVHANEGHAESLEGPIGDEVQREQNAR